MKTKPFCRKSFLTAAVAALLVLISACALIMPEETEPPTVATAAPTLPPETAVTTALPVRTVYVTATPTPPPTLDADETEAGPAVQTWPEGTYAVGPALKAGDYVLVAENEFSAYLEIASDDSREFESIIFNDNFYNRTRVELKEGEFFSFNNAVLYRSEDAPAIPAEGNLPDGLYLVGVDIPAGTYTLEATESIGGYYAVFDNARHDKYGYLHNFNFLESAEVTVNDGEYLHVARAVLVRP